MGLGWGRAVRQRHFRARLDSRMTTSRPKPLGSPPRQVEPVALWEADSGQARFWAPHAPRLCLAGSQKLPGSPGKQRGRVDGVVARHVIGNTRDIEFIHPPTREFSGLGRLPWIQQLRVSGIGSLGELWRDPPRRAMPAEACFVEVRTGRPSFATMWASGAHVGLCCEWPLLQSLGTAMRLLPCSSPGTRTCSPMISCAIGFWLLAMWHMSSTSGGPSSGGVRLDGPLGARGGGGRRPKRCSRKIWPQSASQSTDVNE